MAQISTNGEALVIILTTAEKVEAVRGDLKLPLSAVRSVEVLENAIHEVHGLRPGRFKVTGTYLPGRIALGTFLAGGLDKRMFCAVHGDGRGLRIRLNDDSELSELIISCDDPEGARKLILRES